MIVALMRYPAGQPSRPHSHPNEQWIFILEGDFEIQFDGKDVLFFTCKDAWLAGPAGLTPAAM